MSLPLLLLRILITGMATFGGPFVSAVQAHDARPVSITIRELSPDRFSVDVRAPESVTPDNFPEVHTPARCKRIAADAARPSTSGTMHFLLVCQGGLQDGRFEIRYPIYNPSLSTLFRLEEVGKTARTALLPPDAQAWDVPATPGALEVVQDYLMLGIEHIFAGLDHLLFVLGLLIIARTPRRVLLAVTGFTLAHSLTLALSVLDVVRLPSGPVEAAIALSILFLAGEIAHPQGQRIATRHPGLVAAAFGLLHGFGFAGALREVGLPQGEVATALLGFNMGVEMGQLIFIGAVTAAFLAARRAWRALKSPVRPRISWSQAAAYVIGPAAAFWLISRIATF